MTMTAKIATDLAPGDVMALPFGKTATIAEVKVGRKYVTLTLAEYSAGGFRPKRRVGIYEEILLEGTRSEGSDPEAAQGDHEQDRAAADPDPDDPAEVAAQEAAERRALEYALRPTATPGPSYIRYYAESLGNGRGILRCDVVIDGQLVNELSGLVGSPAPLETIRKHESKFILTQEESGQ